MPENHDTKSANNLLILFQARQAYITKSIKYTIIQPCQKVKITEVVKEQILCLGRIIKPTSQAINRNEWLLLLQIQVKCLLRNELALIKPNPEIDKFILYLHKLFENWNNYEE